MKAYLGATAGHCDAGADDARQRHWFVGPLTAKLTQSIPATRSCVLMIACAAAVANASAAGAQPIAEYLFWDSIGNAAGAGVKSYVEYREQRELWARKIAEGKAAMERCGNCPERAKLEKELAYWQQTEAKFQEIAGAAAAAVGMPKSVANWLGIDAPMAPPPSRAEWERRNRVVRPAWVDDRPPFCQQASNAYLQCLRDYQKRTGSLPTDVAKQPGGACYEDSKFFRHCFAEDYDAFEREKALQAARAGGRIIPEYVSGSAFQEVYYGQVPDTFVPTLPPDVVRTALRQRPSGIRLSTRKTRTGFVEVVLIEPFFWSKIVPTSDCFSGQGNRSEIERRICDDLSSLTFKERPPVLTCRYVERGSAAPGSETRFWFGDRPAAADPKRLLSRSSDHPVLTIGNARTACPASRAEAEQASAAWSATLKRLRAATPQTSTAVALPEAAWRKEARDANRKSYEAGVRRGTTTQNFPFEGRYSFETTLGGRSLSGECVISPAGLATIFYLLRCRHDAGDDTIRATLLGGYLRADWRVDGQNAQLQYQVDPSDPNALVAKDPFTPANSGRLVRTGDLRPLAGFGVAGTYRFEVTTGKGTESGRCTVSREERMQPPGFKFDCTTDAGQTFSNAGHRSENAIVVSFPVLAGVPLHQLVFVAGGEDGSAQQPSLIGTNESGARVRLMRIGGQ